MEQLQLFDVAEYQGATAQEILRDLIGVIGEKNTQALVREYGGMDVYVPISLPANHWLLQLFGEALAAEISRLFAGCTIYVPKGVRAVQSARDLLICHLAKSHKVRELVRRFGLCERRIYQILRKGREVSAHAALKPCTLPLAS